MNPEYLPWNLLAATIAVGIETEGWNLAEGVAEDGPLRSFHVPVSFAAPFIAPPVVHLGLTGFDIDQRSSSRISLSAESITAEGFVANISTWRSSRVYSVTFQWLAVGA